MDGESNVADNGARYERDRKCECGSLPKDHVLRNYDFMWHDGDVYCGLCGGFVRFWDAG